MKQYYGKNISQIDEIQKTITTTLNNSPDPGRKNPVLSKYDSLKFFEILKKLCLSSTRGIENIRERRAQRIKKNRQ